MAVNDLWALLLPDPTDESAALIPVAGIRLVVEDFFTPGGLITTQAGVRDVLKITTLTDAESELFDLLDSADTITNNANVNFGPVGTKAQLIGELAVQISILLGGTTREIPSLASVYDTPEKLRIRVGEYILGYNGASLVGSMIP